MLVSWLVQNSVKYIFVVPPRTFWAALKEQPTNSAKPLWRLTGKHKSLRPIQHYCTV